MRLLQGLRLVVRGDEEAHRFWGHGLQGFSKGKLMGSEFEDNILEFVWSFG